MRRLKPIEITIQESTLFQRPNWLKIHLEDMICRKLQMPKIMMGNSTIKPSLRHE